MFKKLKPSAKVHYFKEQIELAETILGQTKKKLAGEMSIADRIVSFHDPQARPIRKGKLDKPTEFGPHARPG